MHVPKLIILALVLLAFLRITQAGYGDPDNTFKPNYFERLTHVLSNAVRMDPSQYKTIYMKNYRYDHEHILKANNMGAREPMFHISSLGEVSRAHSNDLNNNCQELQHNSCDGTNFANRIRQYYDCGSLAENVAVGYSSPLDVVNGWLCDRYNNRCADDNSDHDGHRRNIMGSRGAVGHGYVNKWWTQDFGDCYPNIDPPSLLVRDGSHLISGDQIKFMASYKNDVAPTNAYVFYNQTWNEMELELGTDKQGLYVFETNTDDMADSCFAYFFKFEVNSKSQRYPAEGSLLTTKQGNCDQVYTTESPDEGSSTESSQESSNSKASNLYGLSPLVVIIVIAITILLEL
eukprot:gb/GECH01009989.1/.p1 GENE.gb/GECH01009989.1/~~gb/GECH01009989.1/.p1  ORF type:complete len:346 (+),score=90.25 gb/GECH01009989.1/:1-1038(+)